AREGAADRLAPRPAGRWGSCPFSGATPAAIACLRLRSIRGARLEHGLDDGDIAGAAAEIAREHLAHARSVAVRLLAEQRVRGRDHPGRAEAALQRVVLAKGFLQRREVGVVG